MRGLTLILGLLVACGPGEPTPELPVEDALPGLLGRGPLDPFPNAALVGPDGGIRIPAEALPQVLETPVPVERLAWRTGFSPAQPSVVRLSGVEASALPGFDAPTPGEGGVRLYDLTAGVALPVMAELDAWPDQDEPVLLVRPLEAMPVGHRVAVAVTVEAAARPERFHRLISGDPPAGLEDQEAHYVDLVSSLEALGLPRDAVALAWDFPIGDGSLPLRSARGQLALDGGFGFDEVRELDDEDPVAPFTWRAAQGSFTVQDFLVDDRLLALNEDGSVQPTGLTQAELYVHIPESVADAPAGSVPVMIFGHGIFGQPAGYLDTSDDKSALQRLADELEMVVVATTWRGLTFGDRGEVLEAAQDFGRLPVITDRLVQGVTNTVTLSELVRTPAFVQHPALAGRDGQALVDPERVYYYGISLGGIEGMVLLAQGVDLQAAVAHVGGAMWATMLERSSNWPVFELLMVNAVTDPADRQLLYALSQLFWDPADPMSWVSELREQSFLLQVSVGDEQVPNFTSEALARSVGMPVLAPAVQEPSGLQVLGDQPPGSQALVQFDPERPLPEPVNRPAKVTQAHTLPRHWAGTRAQIADHFRLGLEGQVVHHCGASPCAASNPGE